MENKPEIVVTHKQAVTEVLANQAQLYHALLKRFNILPTTENANTLAALGTSIAQLSEAMNRASNEELVRIKPKAEPEPVKPTP